MSKPVKIVRSGKAIPEETRIDSAVGSECGPVNLSETLTKHPDLELAGAGIPTNGWLNGNTHFSGTQDGIRDNSDMVFVRLFCYVHI